MEAYTSDQMERLIWEKLVVNVGINAITALTGIHNGWIASDPEARKLATTAAREAYSVGIARSIALREEIVDRVLTVAQATARNRSSMGQDVDRRQQTEIDAINGAIIAFGREARIPTPVNETLFRLVKILEASFQAT
jgi:2-dehydropantoate 2-reductase